MVKRLCLFALMFSLLGCSTPRIAETADPNKNLAEAYHLLSVYRAKRARRLIDESIEIYKQQGNNEKLAYAYFVSTDFYRYVASDAYRKYKGEPTLNVTPIPIDAVMGVRTENVWTAHTLAEETYKKVIADAVSAKEHFKASYNYQYLFLLYARNAQIREACDALDGEIKQYNLGKTANPDKEPFNFDRSKYKSVTEVIGSIKESLKCVEVKQKPGQRAIN